MGQKFQIDAIDRKIISMLTDNARTPYLEIARICGMSGAAIHQRVQKLEHEGIISGSQIKVIPENIGYRTCAFVGILLDKANRYHSVVNELKKIPEITESHYTTGHYTIFIKVYCKDNQHLMDVLNGQIQNIEGISTTETFISLEQGVNRQLLP